MSDGGEYGSQRLRISLVTAAKADPVTLSEAKLHCRVDETADNDIIQSLIRAATAVCENHMRRPIMTQEFKVFLDRWPCGTFIELPKAPLISVTSVKTYDEADVATVFSSANYYTDTATLPGRIVLRAGNSWPQWARYANPIEIQFKAGYGDDPNGVPPEIRQAVLSTVAFLYENRGDAVAELPEIACLLLAAHRDWRF